MDSQVLAALGLAIIGGLSNSLGAVFVILNDAPNLKMLGLLQGFAAGLMLSISFLYLAHNAMNSIGFLRGNLWFFAGIIFFALLSYLVPEPELAPSKDVKNNEKSGGTEDITEKHRRQVLYSGIITAIGISLHNFPEGMAVYLGSMKGLRVGLNLALAIALHNIPEGVAVALPVYFATQSKWQALKYVTLSGLAEPLGVIIVAILFPSNLSHEILEGLLGSVGGVMAFLTLHEMLPLAFEYAGPKPVVKAVFCGMAFMSTCLHLLDFFLPEAASF
uniref:Zinc transporter ZTP29 n=1 Tax=Kalanchoe fedtschenkoi TaxID=63787 RepID=A0A7N0RIA1_KALFE